MSTGARVGRLVLRRLTALALTLLVVSGLAFAALERAPAPDEGIYAPPATLQGSAIVRYGRWLGGALHLDLGRSWHDGRPVALHLAERLPLTLALAALALLLAHAIAVPLAVECSARRGGRLDRMAGASALALESVPSYWIGSLLLVLLAGGAYLQCFPIMGLSSDGEETSSLLGALLDRAWHLTLPVICLTLALLATVLRVCRAALGDAMEQAFIRTALAKGASSRSVLWRHGLRHAAAPMVALFAALVAPLLGGTAVVESLFGLPGLGLLAWQATVARDAPVLLGVLWVTSLVVGIVLALGDAVQALLDPRLQSTEDGR